jgi:hypothetical protein
MGNYKKDPESGADVELRPPGGQLRSCSSTTSSSASKASSASAAGGGEEETNPDQMPSSIDTLCSPCLDILQKDRYELAEELKDALISSIPPSSVDSDDLERTGFALHIAVVFQATFLFFLLYIGITDFQYNKKAEFLSPSLSEGDCDVVPISVKNNYYADKYGYWDTEDQFQVVTSTYFAYFSGIPFDEEDYLTNMTEIQSKLQNLADRGAERDLAYTLTALASYHTDGGGNAMGLKYAIVPEIMFDYVTGESGISDASGDCVPFGDTPIFADFDRSSKSIIFRTKVFNGTKGAQPCSQIIAENFYANEFSIDSNGFVDISFDIRSILTAVAVNRGIMKVRDLRPLYSDLFQVFVYTDPAYSDMTPLYCIYGLKETDPDSCLVITSNYYLVYPSMAQFGDYITGIPCTCPYNASHFHYDDCNVNNILINLVYLNGFSSQDYVQANNNFAQMIAQYRVRDPVYGDVNATEVARRAHVSVLRNFTEKMSRQETFADLCVDFNCTLFHIQLYGEIGYTNVNAAGTQLAEYFSDRNPGACKRALFNDVAFQTLLTKTPAPLQESYYVCRTPAMTAFQRAVGVASGSASLYSSIALSMLLFFAVRSFNDEKRRRAETRMSQIEIDFASLRKDFSVLAQKYSDLADVNSKLVRQNEDLTKALVQVRNDVIGVKVDVARS